MLTHFTHTMTLHVAEATNYCAYLSKPDGFDIVTLHRVLPDEVTDPEHKSACLTDAEWQSVINLMDAAPRLLSALRDVLEDSDAGNAETPETSRWPAAHAAILAATTCPETREGSLPVLAKSTDSVSTPSERSDTTSAATMRAAAELLGASYDFPGYICTIRNGRVFHFGAVDGDAFRYDSHRGDDDSVSLGGGASLPITATAAELAAWITAELDRHAAHLIIFRPLASLDDAKELFRYLHANHLTFHPDDDPAECRLPITAAAADALRQRMLEADTFSWGEDGCPCGYALSLDPEYCAATSKDEAQPPASPVTLERYCQRMEYFTLQMRILTEATLAENGLKEEDCQRLCILNRIYDLEKTLNGVQLSDLIP